MGRHQCILGWMMWTILKGVPRQEPDQIPLGVDSH